MAFHLFWGHVPWHPQAHSGLSGEPAFCLLFAYPEKQNACKLFTYKRLLIKICTPKRSVLEPISKRLG